MFTTEVRHSFTEKVEEKPQAIESKQESGSYSTEKERASTGSIRRLVVHPPSTIFVPEQNDNRNSNYHHF